MNILHKAYAHVERCERCWSDGDKQASERARIIVEQLFDAGILVEAAKIDAGIIDTELSRDLSAGGSVE